MKLKELVGKLWIDGERKSLDIVVDIPKIIRKTEYSCDVEGITLYVGKIGGLVDSPLLEKQVKYFVVSGRVTNKPLITVHLKGYYKD